MPLARDFFELVDDVYGENPTAIRWGHVIAYVSDTRGSYGTAEGPFRPNIEAFMSEVESRCQQGAAGDFRAWLAAKLARDQLYEAIPLALNRLQSGPVCKHYRRLASVLRDDDAVVTFNWDTLLDRALLDSGRWFPDDGYAIRFSRLLDGVWRDSDLSKRSVVRYLKLHGSANWLLNWLSYDVEGVLQIPADTDGALQPLCFVDGSQSYETWDDDRRTARQPMTFPYLPRSPISGMPTLAAIIPPVQQKNLQAFADFLAPVWDAAHQALSEATEWFIAGYSFPETDGHINSLLRDAYRDDKSIWVIDPFRRGRDIANQIATVLGHRGRVHAPRMGFSTFVERLATYGR